MTVRGVYLEAKFERYFIEAAGRHKRRHCEIVEASDKIILVLRGSSKNYYNQPRVSACDRVV